VHAGAEPELWSLCRSSGWIVYEKCFILSHANLLLQSVVVSVVVNE
jgi:hypothetical protein